MLIIVAMNATTRRKRKKMTGAEYLINKFGRGSTDQWRGINVIANAINRHKTSVWRWTQPKEKGGTDGRVPTSILKEILEEAERLNINIDIAKVLEY